MAVREFRLAKTIATVLWTSAPEQPKVGGTHDTHAAPGRACHVRDAGLDKALAYYTEVNGLVLNSRDKDRAYLASRPAS